MDKKDLLSRIVVDSAIMVGKPIIKGTRLAVQYILGLLAQGMTVQEIIDEYTHLTKEDINACLFFAREALDNTTFMPFELL